MQKQHSWDATNGPVSLVPTIIVKTTKHFFNAITTFNWNANKIFIFPQLPLQEDGKLFKWLVKRARLSLQIVSYTLA